MRKHLLIAVIAVFFTVGLAQAVDVFDLVSGILESAQFKGRDPIDKLKMASDLLRNKQVQPSDFSFLLLDWGDQYLREPTDRLDRLRRWAELSTDDQFGNLRIPRDFLNRILVAEYLVEQTAYLKSPPHKRLELIGKLTEKNLVDWSVNLAYARLYAGGIVTGAAEHQIVSPVQALMNLKKLSDQGLVNWHYRVSTEPVLLAEALAMDQEYRKGSPFDQLSKLKALEEQGIITEITKKEMEKLPAWRLLGSDTTFIKGDRAAKSERLAHRKTEGMISPSTCSDLLGIFRQMPVVAPMESRPAPMPKKVLPGTNSE